MAAVAASLTAATATTAQAKPPPNPSDAQIHNAQQQRDAVADKVASLGAKVATLQQQLHQLQAAQEMAEQKYALSVQRLEQATDNAKKAAHAATNAQQRVVTAQREFVAYAQSAYMGGSVRGMTGTLLTAPDPSALLQRSALEGYQSSHQIGAIDDLRRATVAKANADSAARLAVHNRTSATQTAAQAKQAAITAVANARARESELKHRVASAQAALEQARDTVATLNGERAAYVKWHKHQLALIAARKRRERLAKLKAEREAKLRAQQLAEQRAEQSQSDSGSHSPDSDTSAPVGGSWSAAKGREAVQRAEQWLGTMYAWAGGNRYGPTYGVCAGDGAFNDCHITGFDCSGLVIYAWGPYMYLTHYAATQYTQAGSYHPSSANFQPGDLLFWSSNGTIAGIHHVAIYIGNGNVIQAPQSGSVITITPWQDVSWGYYGATRPLT